jgi:hypothetical protein
MGAWELVKASLWPAFLIYKLFEFLKMQVISLAGAIFATASLSF